jgi:hypothetical protein
MNRRQERVCHRAPSVQGPLGRIPPSLACLHVSRKYENETAGPPCKPHTDIWKVEEGS